MCASRDETEKLYPRPTFYLTVVNLYFSCEGKYRLESAQFMFSKRRRLEILIRTSDIPRKYKRELLIRIFRKEVSFPWADTRIKTIFNFGMSNRAYDIFTASISALIDDNEDSLYTLLRAQVENIFATNYFIKNPSMIRESLKPEFYDKKGTIRKFVHSMDNRKYWSSLYRFLTNRAHPFADGLKSCFGNYYTITIKNGVVVNEPTLCINPDNAVDREDLDNVLEAVIGLFDVVNDLLVDMLSTCPDDKIENYKMTHKKVWSDYYKESLPTSF